LYQARRRDFWPAATLDPRVTADFPFGLGVGVGTIKTLIQRLRKQYLAAVREEVARTASNPAELKARSARCVMRWSPPKDG
jgi:hypothetical protein